MAVNVLIAPEFLHESNLPFSSVCCVISETCFDI